jgi:RNA polymerase sigma-70 factor (ECF subfamily)
MSTLLEKHIVELLLERDEKAISLLYEHYGDTLYGVAFKVVRDEELAQDILQESFIKIWKKSDTYDSSKAKLFTWLFRITRNAAIDKLRSINTKSEKEIQIDVSDVYNLGVDSIKPELIDVKENLDKIESKYQVVLDALFFQGMTQQEASDELDIPLGTIKSRLKIGLRELKKFYGTTMVLSAFLLDLLILIR